MFKSKNSKEAEFGTVNIKCSVFLNKEQETLLNQHFGHSRFVYNWAVSLNKELYDKEKRSLSYVELQNKMKLLKEEEETSFLKQADSTCLQQALQDYCQSYKMFLQRKGGYPTFRNKYDSQTCRIINVSNRIRFDGNKLKLGKFGWVRTKPHQTLPNGSIKSVTIKRSKTGKVYITVTIRKNTPNNKFAPTGKEVGIDVGVKDFACFSDGVVIPKPDFLEKDDKKLRKLHRQLSRKQKGSKNREKAIHKLAIAYEKDRNRREDFLNKLSLSIVKDYDLIVMENLDIQSMLKDKKNKNLHKSIHEIGWYNFIQKVKYKSEWYGKVFVQVEKSFPSSQLCSHCGYKNTETKDLSIRKWTCPECRTVHDRDRNASINILREGKRIISE